MFSQKGLDFDVNAGVATQLKFTNRFQMISGFSFALRRTEDLNGKYFNTGLKLDLLPGLYTTNWVVAPHLGLDYRPFIHIKHKAYATNTFKELGSTAYSAPENGWFTQNNLLPQIGIGTAYFKQNWNINLVAGLQHQPNKVGLVSLPDIGLLPFYGHVNFAHKVGK